MRTTTPAALRALASDLAIGHPRPAPPAPALDPAMLALWALQGLAFGCAFLAGMVVRSVL